jgi:hypothetical protein
MVNNTKNLNTLQKKIKSIFLRCVHPRKHDLHKNDLDENHQLSYLSTLMPSSVTIAAHVFRSNFYKILYSNTLIKFSNVQYQYQYMYQQNKKSNKRAKCN